MQHILPQLRTAQAQGVLDYLQRRPPFRLGRDAIGDRVIPRENDEHQPRRLGVLVPKEVQVGQWFAYW